ncbi:MAG: 50S ribosomal protein L25 [Patescibacteria group bacterium]
MEENLQLKAISREEKAKQNKYVRSKGMVPSQVYGKNSPNVMIKIDAVAFEKIYAQAKESTLVDLIIDDQTPIKVLIHDISRDRISDHVLHVDFYKVNMTEKIDAEIDLNFLGIAPAVKELGGILTKQMDKIEIRCFPNELIKEIDVDVTTLKTFTDVIRVKDIKLPSNMELISDPEQIAINVAEPRSEEELSDLNQKVEENVSKVESTVEKKKDVEADTDTTKDAKK